MKKVWCMIIILIVSCTMAIVENTLSPTFAMSPESTLQHQENMADDFLTITQKYLEKEYENAFTLLTAHHKEFPLFQEDILSTILEKYKRVITIKATAYLKNNQPDQALSVLKPCYTYYAHDQTFQKLYQDATYQSLKNDWVKHNGEISHLSLYPLITRPKIDLGDSTSLSSTLYEDYLTPTEFKNILSALYNNNYILVDIYDVFGVTNTTVTKKELYLPEGKKPLLLTFEDVCYTKAQKSKGSVDKLILDRKHRLASYTSKKAIQDRVSYEEECITLLESFIATHPDFSHHGARAIITLSGEEGILGYRTQKSNANSRYDIKKALEVVTKLKNLGYRFASAGYSHDSITSMNTLERNKNLYNWQEEVGKIVGATPIYYLSYNDLTLTKEVLQSLQEYGYTLIIGALDTPDTQLSRLFLCGRTLLNSTDTLSPFFDASKVYDKETRQG